MLKMNNMKKILPYVGPFRNQTINIPTKTAHGSGAKAAKILIEINTSKQPIETSIKKRGGEDVERDIIAVSTILNLAVNDYIEVYAYGNTDNSGAYTILAGTNQSHFSICRIIGA